MAKVLLRVHLRKWSSLVRANQACAVCGATTFLNAHHILPKERYKSLRLVVENGITLCPSHHRFGKFSAHRNAIWFAEWLRTNRPEQYAWALQHINEE